MSLLVTGSLALDDIETPFGCIKNTIGGSASYISICAAHFERNTQLISKIGNDFDRSFLKTLHQKKVDISAIEISQTEKTFYWKGKYSQDLNSRNSISTELNVLKNYTPKIPTQFSRPDY